MTSVGLVRDKTFDDVIRSRGTKIEPPYRPFTELQRDPKITAFNFQAGLDAVREHEIRALVHRRRMEDIRETAASMGLAMGQVLAQQPPPPTDTSGMMDGEYDKNVEISEYEREARIMRAEDNLRRGKQKLANELREHAEQHKEFGEYVVDATGDVWEAVGTALGGGMVGGGVRSISRGTARTIVNAADSFRRAAHDAVNIAHRKAAEKSTLHRIDGEAPWS